MDPTRRNADTSELEQQLLDLAREDRIPAALSARMAEGLGVQVAGAAAHGGLAAGSKLTAPLFAKTGLWGVLSIALVAAVATWYAAPSATRPVRAARHEPAASPVPALAHSAVATSAAASAASAAGVASVALEQTAPFAEVTAPSRARPAAASDDAALRAEVALLDRVRDALRTNAGARALPCSISIASASRAESSRPRPQRYASRHWSSSVLTRKPKRCRSASSVPTRDIRCVSASRS